MSDNEQLFEYESGQPISIKLHSKYTVEAFFYCFDPETRSIIVEDKEAQLIWINGRDIKKIQNPSIGSELSPPQTRTLQSNVMQKLESVATRMLDQESDEKLEILSAGTKQIQWKLMSFLSKHQLSPELTKLNIIRIGTTLSIKPPYDQSCCRSTNETVLSTVLKLLDEFHAESDNNQNMNGTQTQEQSDSDEVIDID